MAAKQLGLAEIPVMVATGWSEAQKRAYVIADNKLALQRRLGRRPADGLSSPSCRRSTSTWA